MSSERKPVLRAGAAVVAGLGVACLVVAGLQLRDAAAAVDEGQERLDDELQREWTPAPTTPPVVELPYRSSAPPSATAPKTMARQSARPAEGEPLAKLYLPTLGLHWTVVDDVTTAALRTGPGHYPGSQLPGEAGNFGIAGHRIRSVFWDVDTLADGDPIVVRTADRWLVYRVYRQLVVDPDDVWVLDPNPGDAPWASPSFLTLTTCTPKGSNAKRLVVHAQLESMTGADQPAPVPLE